AGDRRLPGWPACRPRQREPGRGVHSGVPALTGRNAIGAKHPDQLPGTAGGESPATDGSRTLVNASHLHMHLQVARTSLILSPDLSRVLLRPFNPGSPQRMARIIARIMAFPEERVQPLLDQISAEFAQRH